MADGFVFRDTLNTTIRALLNEVVKCVYRDNVPRQVSRNFTSVDAFKVVFKCLHWYNITHFTSVDAFYIHIYIHTFLSLCVRFSFDAAFIKLHLLR